MAQNKLMNMLGLCARAGALRTGQQAVEELIRRDGALICLIDDGTSQGSKKALMDACASHNTRYAFLPAFALGDAVGKPGRMAAAVTDRGFAKRIDELLNDTHM